MTQPARRRLYAQLEPTAYPGVGLSLANRVIIGLIVASLLLFTLQTEPAVRRTLGGVFLGLDLAIAVIFAVEYVARIWAAGEERRYRGIFGRLRYMITPMAVIDFLAFAPSLIFFGQASGGYALRLIRLLRVLRLLKLGRYFVAIKLIERALARSGNELVVTMVLAAVLLFVGAIGLYAIEGGIQPENFGSIPRALWWAVATLTTVGYGDVFPVTPLGKIFAAFIALIGIGVVALPTGIITGNFMEALTEHRADQQVARTPARQPDPAELGTEIDKAEDRRDDR